MGMTRSVSQGQLLVHLELEMQRHLRLEEAGALAATTVDSAYTEHDRMVSIGSHGLDRFSWGHAGT
jgi:hypothetical protein